MNDLVQISTIEIGGGFFMSFKLKKNLLCKFTVFQVFHVSHLSLYSGRIGITSVDQGYVIPSVETVKVHIRRSLEYTFC